MAREVVLIAFDLRTAVAMEGGVWFRVDLRAGLRRMREVGLTSMCELAPGQAHRESVVLSMRRTCVGGTDGYGRIGVWLASNANLRYT
jgi:hypothetical protein